jgi:Anti-sigma factor NepR
MRLSSKRDRQSPEWLIWCQTKDQIGHKLREYYRACTAEELPPHLLALVKRLDEKPETLGEQVRSQKPEDT